jgi:hypothetical protein
MVDKKGGPCVGQKYERWITSSRLCVLGKIFPDASDWCVLVGCRMNEKKNGTQKITGWHAANEKAKRLGEYTRT